MYSLSILMHSPYTSAQIVDIISTTDFIVSCLVEATDNAGPPGIAIVI